MIEIQSFKFQDVSVRNTFRRIFLHNSFTTLRNFSPSNSKLMSEVKMLFYPNKAKMNPSTRLIPVYTRIWKRNQKVEVKLDVYLHETDLGSWDIFTQRLSSANNEVNRRLEEISFDFRGLKYIHKSDYEK